MKYNENNGCPMLPSDIYEKNISHFRIQKRYQNKVQAFCPAHKDNKASLTISMGDKGTLFHCHAGCPTENILSSVGLSFQDTFYENIELKQGTWENYIEKRTGKRIEAIYHYTDLSGNYSFTKIRLTGKEMQIGIVSAGRWKSGLGGKPQRERTALYGDLQKIQRAIKESDFVFICEGEKDVNTLASYGYAAFTYGGTSNWNPALSSVVEGAAVIVLGDNDEPGRAVVNQIYRDIKDVAASVKIVFPMPNLEHGDVSDFFGEGKSKEDFEMLIKSDKEEAIDLDRFHLFDGRGVITGPFHYEIYKYLKECNKLFILGSTPYFYHDGCYIQDRTGAYLKTKIKNLIYPRFIKSTTIDQIYKLFLQDVDLEKKFNELNQYPSHWICFKNGMYDAKNKRMLEHSPDYFAINQIPHNFNPDKSCLGLKTETFLNFICEDPEDKEMLLQFLGYSLTKDVAQQKFLVLNGEGGTGKSTVIRLLEELVGSENISNISLMDLPKRFAPFGLMGKLLNSCADLEVGALEDTSIIKKSLGEDTLSGEQKGKDAFSFKSYAKMIFSTNELPLVKSEKTNGFYRRLLVLTMNKLPVRKNPNLHEELHSELNYLLHLAVDALSRMYESGYLSESKNSKKAVQQLRVDSDTTEAFLQERCVTITDEKIERGVLYAEYEDFCNECERLRLTKNNFYKSLRSKGFVDFKTNGQNFFKGIFLKKNITVREDSFSLQEFTPLLGEEKDLLPFD